MKSKINIIIPGMIKSGGMNVILEYTKRLAAKGFDVMLYYPFANYNLLIGKSEYGLNARRTYWVLKNYLNGRKNKSYFDGIQLNGVLFIKDNYIRDADYIFATSWPTSYDVAKLSTKKGIKFYFIQDIEIWDSNKNLVYESYKLDLKLITICNYLKSKLLNDYGKISDVILNGIDYDVFYPFIEKEYETNKKTISYIDYKLKKKNTRFIIEAVKILKDKYPSLTFKSFGLEKFNEHPNFVHFYRNPNQKEIANIYNESHIFIFASSEEGFGLPPAEAMACKTSVICSPVGAIPEYSSNGKSVLFINPENVESIVESASLLLTDNKLNKSISDNGFKIVRETLNWDNSVNKLMHILK